MLRNRVLSFIGLLLFAVVSVNGQILKGLEKYQYSYTQAEQLQPAAIDGIMLSIGTAIEPEKYVSKMTSLETACCYEEKDVKKFIKTARKLIKKEKASLIRTINNEGMTMDMYAKDGEIILMSNMENELAMIVVIK